MTSVVHDATPSSRSRGANRTRRDGVSTAIAVTPSIIQWRRYVGHRSRLPPTRDQGPQATPAVPGRGGGKAADDRPDSFEPRRWGIEANEAADLAQHRGGQDPERIGTLGRKRR